jgi:hypothetical protein
MSLKQLYDPPESDHGEYRGRALLRA